MTSFGSIQLLCSLSTDTCPYRCNIMPDTAAVPMSTAERHCVLPGRGRWWRGVGGGWRSWHLGRWWGRERAAQHSKLAEHSPEHGLLCSGAGEILVFFLQYFMETTTAVPTVR